MTDSRLGARRDAHESRAVRSIATISRSVLRRARHAHYARAICGALATLSLTIAFALERGSQLGDAEVYLLALLLALAALIAWVRSERIESRAVLERIDQRMHLSGAFLSAHESCEATPDAPLAQLAAAKLLQRVRPAQALEAAVPHTLGFVALPLVGVLVLVQMVQLRDARHRSAGRVTVEVGTVADHIGDIERMNRARLSAMQREELARIQRTAEAAAKEAADQFLDGDSKGDPTEEEGSRSDWRDQLRSVADGLDQLASEAKPGSELAEQLTETAAEAESLAMGSEAPEASPPEAESGDGRFAGAEGSSGGGDPSLDTKNGSEPGDSAGGGLERMVEGDDLGDDLALVEGASTEDGITPDGKTPEGIAPDDVMPGNGGSRSLPAGTAAEGALAESGSGEVNGEVKKAAILAPESSDGAQPLGVLQPTAPGEASKGQAGDDRAPRDPVPEGALALLDRTQWWADRDDEIVRAWLAQRVPK